MNDTGILVSPGLATAHTGTVEGGRVNVGFWPCVGEKISGLREEILELVYVCVWSMDGVCSK